MDTRTIFWFRAGVSLSYERTCVQELDNGAACVATPEVRSEFCRTCMRQQIVLILFDTARVCSDAGPGRLLHSGWDPKRARASLASGVPTHVVEMINHFLVSLAFAAYLQPYGV